MVFWYMRKKTGRADAILNKAIFVLFNWSKKIILWQTENAHAIY
jgi:hypothetical protein